MKKLIIAICLVFVSCVNVFAEPISKKEFLNILKNDFGCELVDVSDIIFWVNPKFDKLIVNYEEGLETVVLIKMIHNAKFTKQQYHKINFFSPMSVFPVENSKIPDSYYLVYRFMFENKQELGRHLLIGASIFERF